MNKVNPDIDAIRAQVLENCAISDSHHAGLYSICGLALRLRDLYKWEKGMDPWEEKEPHELLEWIGEKEEEWERVAEKGFRDITIHGKPFDPLDLAGINTFLEPKGLLYGAGFVQGRDGACLLETYFLPFTGRLPAWSRCPCPQRRDRPSIPPTPKKRGGAPNKRPYRSQPISFTSSQSRLDTSRL